MSEDIVKGVSRALARGVSRAVLALCAAASAVTFDVDVEGVRPALLEAYRGESFEIAARFPQDFGVSSARFLWMTNTAADADVFATNATVSADGVVRTVFTGAMDAGAPVVPFFFAAETRVGTCLRASGMIRFRPSPGVSPSTEPFPSASRTLDFAKIEALNAPWTTWEAVEALVRDATNGIPAPPPAPDLSTYATKEEVASKIAASTNALVASIPQPDLAPYCTIEAARAMDAAVSNALAEAIASIRVPSLDGYATEAWVASALAGISQPDLSPYATKAYADAAAADAAAGVQVPSLEGYAKETYVDAKVAAIPAPDLSPYATKEYADAAAADAAAGVQVPSLEGYAKETYVDAKVAAIPAPDLSPYATKAYADAAAANAAAGVQVPSLEGYATKSELDALKRRYADTNGVTRLWSEDGLTMTDGTGVVWSVSWAAVTNWVSITNGIVYRPTAPGVWIGDGIITNGEGAVGVGRIEYGRGMPEWFAFGLDGGGSYAEAVAEGLYLDYSDAVAMLPDAFTGIVERAALYVPMARVVTNDVGYVTGGGGGDYLPLSGGTLTGDLSLGARSTGSRTLFIASDDVAEGISLQGGTSSGEGSYVSIGGSYNKGATLEVGGGGFGGGTVIVHASAEYGGGIGGNIEVRGTGASIKKDGSEVATETYVNTQVSGVESTLTTLAGAVNDMITSATNGLAAKSDIDLHTNDTNNPHKVTAAQVGAVQLVEDVNSNKTAVTIGGRSSIGTVGQYSLSNGQFVNASGYNSHAEGEGTTASGQFSHSEGQGTTASGYYSHAEGYGTTASGHFSHADGYESQTSEGHQYSFAWNGDTSVINRYSSHGSGTFNINPVGGVNGFYIGEQTLSDVIFVSITNNISADNPTFSNAVLAVGLNIDTNSVAVLNEIAETFGGFPIEGTATTVGGLLAALAAAVAWLKKNKVGSFASVGGASATVENGVAKLDDFFTASNSLLTATIDARLPYPLYAVPSTGLLKDRAINTTSLASVTVPDNFTDLLIRASVASSLSVTMPEAITTKYGDTFPGEAGEYLITITKTGAAEAYVRAIKLEVANA